MADIVITGQEPGSGITVTPGTLPNTTDMTAGNGGIGYFSDFDIIAGHTVNCVQGSSAYNALFKVDSATGTLGTQIYGIFNSDGNIYLQDLRGILIGAGGQINTNQFIASSVNIKNSDWQDFLSGVTTQLKFEKLTGDPTGVVNNQGIINAASSVYLVGSQVLNSGIINAPDVLVMAAGDNIFLTHEDSKVLIKVPTDLVTLDPAINKVDIDAASTITAGQVVLAAGDIFSAALNVGSLAATANRDITLEDAVTTTGDITLVADADGVDGGSVDAQELTAGGSIDISAYDNTITLHEDVTADVDIFLNNNTVADADVTLDAGQDVVVGNGIADGTTLTGYGALTVRADRDIYLGGAVEADGTLILKADADTVDRELGATPGGKMWATSTLVTTAGDIDIYGNNIELDDDVIAAVDLILNNDTYVAPNKTLKAGNNVNSKAHLTAEGNLKIEATEGEITAHNIDMDADYKTLTLIQKNKLDLEQNVETWDNRINTHLVAQSTADSVTSEAASKWLDITATAYENIILSDESGNITTKSLTTETGDIKVTAEDGKVYVNGPVDAGRSNVEAFGDVIITATDEGLDGSEDAIFLNYAYEEPTGPEIKAGRDIWLNNNTWAADGVSLEAGQDVRLGWQGQQDPWDSTSGHYAPKTLTGEGALTIEADRHITLGGAVETAGDLILWADKDDVEPDGDMTALGNITSTGGSIDIYASDSTIILTGDKVEASGDVTLHDNTILNGIDTHANQTIEATTGSLYANGSVHKTTTGNLDMFGGYNGTPAPPYSVWTKAVTVDDGELTIKGNANVQLEGAIYSSGNMWLEANADKDATPSSLNHTIGTIESKTGDVELWSTDGDILLFGGTATEYVTAGEDILLHDVTTVWQGRKLDAGQDVVADKTLQGRGALTVEADRHITLNDLVKAGFMSAGDLILKADADTVDDPVLPPGDNIGNMTALANIINENGNIDIYSSDSTTILGGDLVRASGDVTLHNNTELNGGALQTIEATTGKLTTEGYVHKTSAGNLDMFGGFDGPLGSGDYSVMTKEVKVDDGSTDGQLTITGNAFVLLDGDIYSRGRMELTSNADGDEIGVDAGTLEHASGTIKSLNNDIEIDAKNSLILLNGGVDYDPANAATTTYVSAGEDILLYSDTTIAADRNLDAGQDVIVGDGSADGTTLTGLGALTVEADRHITLGGLVEAGTSSAGDLILAADADDDEVGNMTANGNVINDNGNIIISSADSTTYLNGDEVRASGNVNLQNDTVAADGILIKAVNGDVVVGVETEQVNPDDYPGILGLLPGVYTDTDLKGDGTLTVQAGSDVIVGGDLQSGIGDLLVTAGDNISVGNAYSWGNMVMSATNGDITAGNLKRVYDLNPDDGDLVYHGGKIISRGGDNMTLTAAGNISFHKAEAHSSGSWWNGEEWVQVYGNGDMYMDAAGGDIAAGVIAPAIYGYDPHDEAVTITQGGSISAGGDMTLLADNDIKAKWAYSNGQMLMDAGHDILIGGVYPALAAMVYDSDGQNQGADSWGTTQAEVLNVHKGGYITGEEITLLAGNDIKLKTAQSGGDVIMTAGQDILVGGPAPHAVYLDEGGVGIAEFDKGGLVFAGDGVITLDAERDISLKMARAEGDITMTAGDNITLRTNQVHPGDDAYLDATESWSGDIRLHALNGDISIAEGYELIAGEFYYDGEVATGGGVSLIADEGKIYSPGGDDDTLTIYVEGSSSQLHGIGVELPGDETKYTAIVIISKEDLKLGPDAALIAEGIYDDTGTVDDREGVGFLDEPLTAIGGIIRDEGEPIDVAVYLESTEGDVDVQAQEIDVDSHGTMVVDAFDTVTLGDLTSGSVIHTLNGTSDVPEGRIWSVDRLEVVSRLTEWLFEASIYGTLPHPYNPEIVEAFIGGDYILRGAGLRNPLITDGRAWVLEDPIPAPPLYTEAGEASDEEGFGEGGCPALMNWLAAEIGVPEDEIQVIVEGAFALSTDIQPCEMCARLLAASNTMQDPDGTQIAAMAQVVNEFVTTPAPPSPEQMTAIAAALAEHVDDGTFYASAGQWIDALVAYVGIMNTEMGYSASDAAAFAEKYVTTVADAGNAALTAYVQTRLAALGG